jgi:hypothetical protein
MENDEIPQHPYVFGAPDTCKNCGERAEHENHHFYREENARMSDDVLAISVIEYRVVKRTPAGFWITRLWDRDAQFKRFVLAGLGRRHAYPTRQLARESFIARKKKEIQHCARQHDRAVRYLALAETGKFGERNLALHEIKTWDALLYEPGA